MSGRIVKESLRWRVECYTDDGYDDHPIVYCWTAARLEYGVEVSWPRNDFDTWAEAMAWVEQDRAEEPSRWSWERVHRALKKHRGRAAEHDCVDCGHPAHEWSYSNADPDEGVDPDQARYSIHIFTHYHPRCRRCHRRFDAAYRRTR